MSSSFGSDSSSSSNSNYDQKLEVPKEDKTPAVQKKQLSQVNPNNLTRSTPQINTDKDLVASKIAKKREVQQLLIRPIRMQAQDSKVTIDEEI